MLRDKFLHQVRTDMSCTEEGKKVRMENHETSVVGHCLKYCVYGMVGEQGRLKTNLSFL